MEPFWQQLVQLPLGTPFTTVCPSSVKLSLAQVEAPSALAVTGNNTEEDLVTTLISGGIVAVFYLFVIPVSLERLAAFGCRADSLVFVKMCIALFCSPSS